MDKVHLHRRPEQRFSQLLLAALIAVACCEQMPAHPPATSKCPQPILSIPLGRTAPNQLAWLPDGKQIVVGFYDHVEVHDLVANKKAWLIGKAVNFALSRDGQLLTVLLPGQTIEFYDLPNRRKIYQPIGLEKYAVSCLALSPNKQILVAAGGMSNTLRVFDVKTGQPIFHFQDLRDYKNAAATALAFAPDGKTLAVGCRDRNIVLWDCATWKVRLVGLGPFYEFASNTLVCYARNGKTLASLQNGAARLCLWDPATGAKTYDEEIVAKIFRGVPQGSHPYEVGFARAADLTASPNGKILALAGMGLFGKLREPGGQIGLFDLAKRKASVLLTEKTEMALFEALGFSHDGQQLALIGVTLKGERHLLLYQIPSGGSSCHPSSALGR